jgi:hypothetical protein
LDLIKADPPIGEPLLIYRENNGALSTDSLRFSIPFRSEDREQVWYAYYLDYAEVGSDGYINASKVATKSSFDDTTRRIAFELPFQHFTNVTPGCHSLTLMVAHQSSFTDDDFSPAPRPDAAFISMVEWLLYIPEVGETEIIEIQCSPRSGVAG